MFCFVCRDAKGNRFSKAKAALQDAVASCSSDSPNVDWVVTNTKNEGSISEAQGCDSRAVKNGLDEEGFIRFACVVGRWCDSIAGIGIGSSRVKRQRAASLMLAIAVENFAENGQLDQHLQSKSSEEAAQQNIEEEGAPRRKLRMPLPPWRSSTTTTHALVCSCSNGAKDARNVLVVGRNRGKTLHRVGVAAEL